MLELGGAQQNTLFTVEHMDRGKFEPILITGIGGPLMEDAKKMTNVRSYFVPHLIREINPIYDLIALIKIWRIVKKEKADVVHTHSSKAGILGRWAAWLAGAPVIIHSIHGYGFHDFQNPIIRWFFVKIEALTARITTAFIAVSQNNLERGVSLRLFNKEKVFLIRSGINIDEFRHTKVDSQTKRRELGIAPLGPLVGMVACFKPQKAPEDFVKVAAIVQKKISEANFLLVGDGELRGEVEALIKEFKLDGKVILTGWRRDIPQIMKMFDVLILTSLWEGLPRVFPQAMAAGIPIVATKVDGAPEVVKEGLNGFLLSPRDIEGLADKVIFLLKSPQIARDMGRAGHDFVEEFDINKMVRQQEELYLVLIGRIMKGREGA